MSLTRAMAPARLRKGCCECSARLLRQRLVSWPPSLPITFIAARYDGSLSVTIDAGRPSRVIARVRHLTRSPTIPPVRDNTLDPFAVRDPQRAIDHGSSR